MAKLVHDLFGLGKSLCQCKELISELVQLVVTREERRLKRDSQRLKNEEQRLRNEVRTLK
jgi:hypothetical protein